MATKETNASNFGRDCSEDDKVAFKEGLNRVISLSDSMIQFMKGVEHRLNKMEDRITELVARVDKFNLNLDTVVTVTKNINSEIAKSTKTECSTKMDQHIGSTHPPEPEPTVSPPIKKDWPLDKQLRDGPIKSLTDLSPKNVRNIIFYVSDEEEGDEMEVDPTKDEVRDFTGTKKISSPIEGQCSKDETTSQRRGRTTRSNFVRRCRGSTVKESKLSGKKLFQTPTSKSPGKGSKRCKPDNGPNGPTNQENETSQTHTPDINKDGLDERTIKSPSSNILPRTMFSRFRPSNDMKLIERELKIVAYIFSYDGDEENMLDDVLGGCTTDELISNYARVWMQPYPDLKYIYVPIKDSSEHWFFMVISLEEQLIYFLDSYLRWEDIRRITTRNVCEALTNIMTSEAYPEDFLNSGDKIDEWELFVARNVINGGTA
ncbi:Ulp1 protease family, C-terminal catalytic domain [Sesbania bispinosa]|nr:Ulp1 protease family, C-terminal catalytic domain [Sesbania bispinosa]